MLELLSSLLEPSIRGAASCVIKVGVGLKDIGELAPLVRTLEIRCSRSEAAMGSLVFDDRRKSDGTWMVADSGLFAPWQPIRISAAFGSHSEELFRGYITRQQPQYPANGGDAGLELQLQDDSVLLDREHRRQVWGDGQPMSDKAILAALVGPHGFSVESDSGDGRQSRSLAQDATPIRFLNERARANGYELIFSEGGVYFGPPRLTGTPQAKILVYAGKDTNCLSFSVNEDAQAADVVRFELAPASGSKAETQDVSSNLPVLGSRPASADGSTLGPKSIRRLSREGDETLDETRERAQALANEQSFKLKADGELDGAMYGHVLKVGRLVPVDGTGPRYGGLYYVDSVNHAFSPQGYRQHFGLIRNGTGETDAPSSPLSSAISAIASLF